VEVFCFTADVAKEELLEQELQVSQHAADRYPNNYHAWSHRMWCLTHLASFASAPLLKEWAASEAWVSSHVSDHSGMQYRQFLLNRLLELRQPVSDDISERAKKSILQFLSCGWSEDGIDTLQSAFIKTVGLIASELVLNTDLILRFAGHEALWCHRRYLLMSLKKFLTSRRADINGVGGSRCSQVSATRDRCAERSSEEVSALHKDKPSNHMNVGKEQTLSSEELAALDRYLCHLQGAMIWHEVKLISSCRLDEVHQQRLAKQHSKWLLQVLKLEIPAVTYCN
jgi:protein prenyltransferase alpha subunit repeat containing protein 1